MKIQEFGLQEAGGQAVKREIFPEIHHALHVDAVKASQVPRRKSLPPRIAVDETRRSAGVFGGGVGERLMTFRWPGMRWKTASWTGHL